MYKKSKLSGNEKISLPKTAQDVMNTSCQTVSKQAAVSTQPKSLQVILKPATVSTRQKGKILSYSFHIVLKYFKIVI